MAAARRRLLACGLLVAWLSCSTFSHGQCPCTVTCSCPNAPALESERRHGDWHVLATENFQVCSLGSKSSAMHAARHSESLLADLRSKWCGAATRQAWQPKCQIVLHRSRREYVRAAGRGSEQSAGTSLVEVDGQRVITRRIDLMEKGTEFLAAALPHELTHVVLQEQFGTTVVPPWADEGMAILADTLSKQVRHDQDLHVAIGDGSHFRLRELLTLEGYPPAHRWGAFYGQSASLTKFLVQRTTPKRFAEFIAVAETQGYDAALRECYGIANLAELERLWRQDLAKAEVPGARDG